LQRRRHLFVVALFAPLLLAGAGCKMVAAPFLMWGREPTKDIPAEWPHLRDKKVCIVVWADADTLVEHPWVQLETAEHVAKALRAHVPGITFVPPRKVYDYQQRDPDWESADPATLGDRFGADRVLMIELTQFTTREPESPHLYRGRAAANLKIFNADYPNSAPVYKTSVEAVYPPDSPGKWGVSERDIRAATIEAFAEKVATRFYERRVKVR